MSIVKSMRWLPVLLVTTLTACGPEAPSTPQTTDTGGNAPLASTPGSSVPESRPFASNTPGRSVARVETDAGTLLLTDIDGQSHGGLEDPGSGQLTTLFFVRTDCPISNQYAPEIRRICADYGKDGVRCFLVYINRTATPEDVRAHMEEFGQALPAILDTDHRWVARAGATVTPEAEVFTDLGELAYRGRIDNLYETLGRPRLRVTETDLRDALDELVRGEPVRTPRTQATGCYIE